MISIAMTSYNGEAFIVEQIDSILVQDYSNFELIICDDCSSDSTWTILKEFENIDKRIKVYHNEVNLGFKKNFEKAISLCKGDYIALADQDDIWEKNHLSVLLNNIGEKYLICGNALCFEMRDGKRYDKYSLFDLDNNITALDDNLDILKEILFKGNPFQGASMLLSRKFLDIVLPIPDCIPFHDVWFALLASCYNSLKYVDVIVNNYRQHEQSVTKRSKESLVSKIMRLPKFNTILKDRDNYCSELIEREQSYNQDVLSFLTFSLNFCMNKNSRLYRWKQYKYFKNNIFPATYRKLTGFNLFARKIQYLFF